MAVLSTVAKEGSTFVVTCSFTDEDGSAVTPATMAWTLTDTDGNTINSRSSVSIESLDTSVDVTLQGDDLPTSGTDRQLILGLVGTYDSDHGTGLPLQEEVKFTVKNLTAV